MKTIGIIGGLAWLSTITYYQEINRIVELRFGDHHGTKLVLIQIE